MANNTLAPDEVLGDPVQVPQQAAPQNTQASQLNDDEVLGDPVQVAQAPQVGAGVTGIAPREEGIWDRTKRVIEDNIPSLSSRTVYDPEYGKQGFIALKSAMTPTEQTEHPILSETLGTLDNLATPANVSIMAATGGLGTLSTPEATAAANVIGKYLPRAISGYFAAQQGWDAVKQTPELYDAMFAKGKYADMSDKDRALEVERLTTRIVETGAVGALAGQHAAGVEATPSTEVGKRAQAIADQTGLRVRQALRSDQRAMVVATGTHQATAAILDQRIAEQQIATEQSVKATKAAEDAKVLFDEGHIGQQELDQANNRASAAAANAGKATKAVVDAHEAHAAAETEVGRMTRKLTQPSTTDKIKTAYGSTVDALGAMLGRTNDFDTAQKRAMKITPKQKLAYDQKIANVREDLQAILNEHPTIDSPKSYADKIDQHIQTQETALQKQAGASKGSDDPVVPNITQRLIDRLDTFFDDNKGLYGDDEDVANAKSEIIEGILQSRNGEHLLEPNLFEAENVRRRLGREGSSQFKPNAIPTTDAYKAGALEAADELRAAIDESYDAKGVKGVKEWRGKEANLIDIRDRLYDAQDKAEKAGKGGVINSLMKKIGVPSTVIAIALGHPVSGAAIGAAVLGDQILQNLTNPNVNLQRAIDIASKNPNARTTVPSRTNTPLHSALAGYFGEFLGQSSYADLQARFAENIADKTRHNVPLEAKDQKILDMLNDAQQKDQAAIQKQREEAKKNAPKITSATLPEDYEVPMHIDGDMPNNMHQHQALVHDIVHAIVADRVGLKPVDGIRAGTGKSLLSAPLDLSEFLDENGELIPDKIRPRIADIAATYVAGGVANDIWHGVPLTENEGVGADFSILDKFMDAAGFSKAERSRIIAEQTDRVRDFLDQPNVRKIIDQHAQVREAGLANTHHFSEDRINQVIKDVRGATNAEPARNTARATGDVHQAAKGNVPGGQEGGKRGPAAGVQPEGNRPASSEGGTVKEGEGANNAATAGGRPKSKGPDEGKGGSTERTATGNEPAAGTDLNPELSNIEVKPADKENPGSFFDNMGINRHTITVNGEPIAKVHTYLHDNGNLDITWLGEQGGQPGRGGAEGKLGTVGIRQVAAQLKELYPEAKKIEYVREGGLVGENFGTRGNIINIRDLNPQLKEDEVKPFKVEWKPNGKYGVVNPKGITLQEFPTREAAEAEAYRAAKQSKEVKVQQQNLHPQLEENKQGGHAGGEVASEEELNRPGRFVKISRSGQPTDQGKVPDFNLREGEAGYQVKPDGSYELKSGQETPLTKRGVEGYAKEVFPNRTTSAEGAGRRAEDVAGREGGGTEAPRPAVQAANLNPELSAIAEKKSLDEHDLRDAANEFNAQHGRPPININPVTEDPRSSRIADSYKNAVHAPNDPAVKASYDALKRDIDQQYDLAKSLGIKMDVKDENPYGLSTTVPAHEELHNDIRNNKHLSVWSGGAPPADHPLSEVDPKTGLTYNDKFRMVHDIFGHAAERTDFSPNGEETAWNLHRQMFSPEARPALATETRGQAAYTYKYGDFPPQKAALLPEEHQVRPEDLTHWSDKIASNLDKQPAGGINPNNPNAESKRYGFEILPEARQALEQNPTAEQFRQYAEQHQKEIDSHPDIKLGWDTTGPKPELNIGASTNDLEKAKQMAAKLDQRDLWDNKEEKTIPVGGTGTKTEFPEYPFEQRLQDLNPQLSKKQQAKDVLDRIAEEYGKSSDASKVQHGASFIHPDGKFSHLGTDDHQQVMFKHGFDAGTDDDRVPFINNSGAVRTNSWTGRQGRTLSFSVPNTGVTPEQIDSMKRAVVPYRSNGQVRIETADTPTQVRSQIKDFPTGNDIEPMLRQIGAHPEGNLKSPDDMLRAELKTELGITGDDPRNGLPNKVLAKQVAAQRAKAELNPKLSASGSQREAIEDIKKNPFDYYVNPPGKTRPQDAYGFLLADGSLAGTDSAQYTHSQLQDSVGFDVLQRANGIRINGPDNVEVLHDVPTDEQRAEIARISKEGGKGKITWDFHKLKDWDDYENYTRGTDSLSGEGKYVPPLESGEGSLGDFLRAADKFYQKPAPVSGAASIGDRLNPKLSPKGSSVPLMKNPLKIEGTGEEGKVNTLDVAKALNQYTKNKLPSLEIGKTEPAEQVERAKKIMEDEAKYQLAQNDTGKAWYTTDMKDHDKVLQGIRPELNVPAKLSMFKMAEAILSSGMKPDSNVKAALNAWDAYQDTGKFPAKNPETGQSWGPRGVKAYGNALDMLNRLIDEKGEQGASDWLLQEHPIKELRQYNTSSTGGHGGGVAGKADDLLPGAYIFGRKRGPFAQNLHGIESAFTADMWVSRSWNRWMGTNEVTPDGELQDAPRSQKEQNLMKQSFAETADKLKLSTSQLQAVLWYYEQSLYDVHGAKKETWSYSDAARKAADDDASTFKFGANVHPGIEALAGTR